MENEKTIRSKWWSARFWAFLMVVGTLCYAVIVSVSAVFSQITVDPVIEKVAMFILGAFVAIATGMYKDYFGREDRQGDKNV